MRRLTGALIAGGVGLAGIVGLGILPASADTTTDSPAGTLTERVQRIRDALSELIDDGTITEDQAAAVAETLSESGELRGHHGGGLMGGASLSAAAETLGLSEEELRDALADGATLADVAEAHDVATADLVAALAAAAQEELDTAVADGRLDQDRADEIAVQLEERITAMVEGDMPGRTGGRVGGPMGGGHHGPWGGGQADEDGAGEEGTGGSADDAMADTASTV